MQMLTGRIVRNLSYAKMVRLDSGLWRPSVDIYESCDEITVYCDLAGITKESLELLVEEHQLHISGRRQLSRPETIVCIHQLELEHGLFARTVAFPVMIDVEKVASSYIDGILVVSLKKKKVGNQITVRIRVGG
jgi:HSP20 family protein